LIDSIFNEAVRVEPFPFSLFPSTFKTAQNNTNNLSPIKLQQRATLKV